MDQPVKRKSAELRKQHNSDLIRRMRNGESLTTVDSRASWYPPRPIIQKDRREMARLYQTAFVSKRRAETSNDDAAVINFAPLKDVNASESTESAS